MFCAKNSSKRELIFEKWQLFENGQNWPLCKGYSPRKMVSLGPKLKFTKTCEKRLNNDTRVVVCRKRPKKIANIRKWQLFESGQNWPLCKGYSPRKTVTLGPKLKFTKTCEKCLYYHTRVVLRKKQLQKRANIWKLTAFWKWSKLATMQGL